MIYLNHKVKKILKEFAKMSKLSFGKDIQSMKINSFKDNKGILFYDMLNDVNDDDYIFCDLIIKVHEKSNLSIIIDIMHNIYVFIENKHKRFLNKLTDYNFGFAVLTDKSGFRVYFKLYSH